MATSYPASLGRLASSSSLESFYPSRHRGTAASLPALLPAAAAASLLLPEMEEPELEPEEETELEDLPQRSRLRRRDHRSLTPTRRIRPLSTRTSSGDDESCTFRSERSLANPRKPNEKTTDDAELANDGDDDQDGTGNNRLSEVREENEDEEQFRRHSKDDELLFRSGRRRSI